MGNITDVFTSFMVAFNVFLLFHKKGLSAQQEMLQQGFFTWVLSFSTKFLNDNAVRGYMFSAFQSAFL